MTTYRFRGEEMPTEASRASILTPADSGDGVYEMHLYDPIDSWGGYWGVSAKEFGEALAAIPDDASEIRLYINSPGGEVWDGIAIVNQLRRHNARVVAIVDGIAASMASVVAATADETVMGLGAMMMIHDAWNIAIGNEAEMLATASRLGKDSNVMAAIYAAKAGGTAEDWRAAMRAETWYTAEEAVDAGLADRTTDTGQSEQSAAARIDLSMFRYAGRAAAPSPRPVAHVATPVRPASSEPGKSNRKESDMSDTLKAGLRERLGITDAEIAEDGLLATLDEVLAEQADDTPTAPAGTVLIDATQLEALRTQAAEGAAARAEQVRVSRDALVDAAVADGRVAPANRAAWRAALDDNEQGTAPLLAALAPNATVPVEEVGHALATDSEDAAYRAIYPGNTKKEN